MVFGVGAASSKAGRLPRQRCFANLNARGWEAKHDAFVDHMVNRFGSEYSHDVIRRLAKVQFETGLEIIKLRDSD
jgi:hypothetical protein